MPLAALQSAPPVPREDPTFTASSDAALIACCADGDASSLAQLYDRYASLAYGIAVRILGDGHAAEDVVQEAFLGVWRRAAWFDGSRASARTWLLAIVHHRAIDAIRRRRSTARLDPDVSLPESLVVPDAASEALGRLDAERVREAMARLSPAQREAIELAYWRGLTQQEIARVTRAPLGTVKSRVRLGLLKLREDLETPASAGERSTPVREERRDVGAARGELPPSNAGDAFRSGAASAFDDSAVGCDAHTR